MMVKKTKSSALRVSIVVPVQNRAELLKQTLSSLASQDFGVDDFEVLGTRGQLKVGPMNGPQLALFTDLTEFFEIPKAENVHLPLVEDFNRAIRQGSEPRVSGEEGMKASIILEAAYQSARLGRVVELAELPAK